MRRIYESPITFIIGLVLAAVGGITFYQTAIVPHMKKLMGDL